MILKVRDVEASLTRKGFRRDDTHHRYFIYFTAAGQKTTVTTYTSQGAKEIDDFLIGQMAKQCGIKKKQFRELVECSLNQERYEKLLVEGEHIEPPAEPEQPEKNDNE